MKRKSNACGGLKNRTLVIVWLIFIIIVISGFAFTVYKNNIENKKNLTLNYWKSSQSARSENNLLDALHLIGEATALSNDKDLLIDGETCLPHLCLKNIFLQNGIVNSVVFSTNGQRILVAGNDGSARILDKTGKQIGPYTVI